MWNMYIWNVLATSPWNIRNIPCHFVFQCVYVWGSCLVMQVSVDFTSSMCLTSLSIYSDPWKSFMKFGIKKSYEMISSIPIRRAWLSEWNYRSSTKPCNPTQMTLDELNNKSHEGFMLSKCQENGPIGLKPYFRLYRVATLTKVKVWLLSQFWCWTLNKICSSCYVEQTLFNGQELVWSLT
jgi:hypothetical protein